MEEEDFMENLRQNIGNRYNRLKRNFEKEYVLNNKARQVPQSDCGLNTSAEHEDVAAAQPQEPACVGPGVSKSHVLQDSIKVYLGGQLRQQR